jgi:hypothetical protein
MHDFSLHGPKWRSIRTEQWTCVFALNEIHVSHLCVDRHRYIYYSFHHA